ncbi:MAG TPA: hypothetical protein VK361_00695 [Rubrobacteraceae bacterium]|nr:hypothetical protein [Rubrobacteraceae bacterium]
MEGHPVPDEVAGDGHPAVLVHGLSGFTRWWSHNLPALIKAYRVYLVDLPGFGTMPASVAASYSPRPLLGW